MSKVDGAKGRAVERGSGNVFVDLGLPNPQERLLKSHLMHAIRGEIGRHGLTQVQAATIAGLKQPELSRIKNGRPSGFSTDRLIDVLRKMGVDVDITLRHDSNRRRIGRLEVHEDLACA